ncbi:LemA family protein [Dermatophilaceae bacterium Soc4.6]
MVTLIVILVVVVGLALVLVGMYNGLIKTRNLVQEAWAQVDVELKRRHDLIGNLVETVKGYATHERGTLDDVTRARSQAMTPGQSPGQVAASEAQLTQALVRLNAVSEAYPDLKANQGFLALQAELASTEDRIASARRYYNANVRELNTKVESIPTSLLAGPAGVSKAEYFEAEGIERQAPQVSFGSSAPSPAAPAVAPPPVAASLPPAAPQDAPYPPASTTPPPA